MCISDRNYLIVEIHYGSLTPEAVRASRPTARPVTAGTPIARAHMEDVRVGASHIHNEYARTKRRKVRMKLRQMLVDIAGYQVDFVGSDANAGNYR